MNKISDPRIVALLQQVGKTLVEVERLLKFIGGELEKIEKELQR